MTRVIAVPCMGVNMPIDRLKAERELDESLPVDAIGEAVTEAVQNADNDGIYVFNKDFVVLVRFTLS